jgi:hypothetical protein
MDKRYNFLHNHPKAEKHLGLDEKHVIVDRGDWGGARNAALNLAIPDVKHYFSIDDPIIVRASLDIRSEYVCCDPLKTPGEIDLQLRGYLVELLNSLKGA